jgi:hypothetical protein
MTPETTAVTQNTEQAQSAKELNFRKQEAMFQRQLEQERAARIETERRLEEALAKKDQIDDDEEDDSEPYVDRKKLNKKLAKFGEQTKQMTQSEIQRAVQMAREEEKKEAWLENNPDFYNVLQENAQKFAQKAPGLAKSILAMPDNFERQKLVYQNIKELGIDRPEQKATSIQEKIDSNRRSPYYQPSGVGTAPYASEGDFSPQGQKQAHDKMIELKNRLRL